MNEHERACNWQVITGDCLDVMPTLEEGSVDAVITDPPYGINTRSDRSGKLNPWADRINSAFWYREWIGQVRRVLKPSGCLWSFLNWRSFTTFQKAADDLGWSIESLLIWDKEWIGPGGLRGLRPSYEMVALWAMPDFSVAERGLADIQRFKWSSTKPNGHPAEKPEALMTWLVNCSTQPGGFVLDIFAGSGTTGAACAIHGRRFLGVEVDTAWAEYARARIARAAEQARQEALPLWTNTNAHY